MVTVELDLKGIISLYESGGIGKDKFKDYLSKFTKDDLIEYLAGQEESESEDVSF